MNNELLDFMTWVNQNKKLGYTPIGIERIVNTYTTSKERSINQIIDEVYDKYHQENKHVMYLTFLLKEEFIRRIKHDTEFSEKWGLKIEERELSLEERYNWYIQTHKKNLSRSGNQYDMGDILNSNNCPTKQTTITYKEQTIESYD